MDIVLVGAGGCAREVLQWICDINAISPTYHIKGFIADDRDTAFNGVTCDYPIIDTIENYQPLPNERLVCSLGSPRGKHIVVDKLKARGGIFETIVHPTAIVCGDVTLGKGCIVYPYTIIGPGTQLGEFVLLMSSTGTDSHIHSYSTVSSYCYIGHKTKIGHDCFLSSHVVLQDHVALGDRVSVGAGSCVVADSGDDLHLFGNPATDLNI